MIYSIAVLAPEPLDPTAAKRLIQQILKSGSVTPSQHALDQLKAREMTMVDVANVLRGGYVDGSEEVNRTWRYRIRTAHMVVVIAFRSESELRIVTGWRVGR